MQRRSINSECVSNCDTQTSENNTQLGTTLAAKAHSRQNFSLILLLFKVAHNLIADRPDNGLARRYSEQPRQ